jgi:uncharacterized protein YbjT (DUF2867 family)
VNLHHAAQEKLLSLGYLHALILAGSVFCMDVVIAGGHGKIALRLTRLLSERGNNVRSLIRNPDHAADVEAAGGEPVVCDMEAEDDISTFVGGGDAAVFAAGAGPGSGPERKRTVDYGAAVKLIDACKKTGIERYAMVSSIGADDPSAGGEQMRPYLQAKHDADEALMQSGLAYTIARPGGLTDDPGTGLVTITTDMSVRDRVPRDDVAAVLATSLVEGLAIRKTFVVVGGGTPIADALRSLG